MKGSGREEGDEGGGKARATRKGRIRKRMEKKSFGKDEKGSEKGIIGSVREINR